MHYRAGMLGAHDPMAATSPFIGQIVEGRYRVDGLIGRGGMGVVYEAHHLLIRRKVALKVLSAHAAFSSERTERFRREALAAAAVGNSHVVDVLDMGLLDSGLHYIVLEHLDGVDLGYAVAVAEQFSVSRAVHVLCQLCDALSAVHEAGIVHRDLKPENVFLIERDGLPDFVKVLDFGICKFLESRETQLTETGETLGTPLFMAPEQVEGRRDVDHRADVYALGALLFFMLTGRAPFDAPSLPMLFVNICKEPPPTLRSVRKGLPGDLDAVLQRAMSKRPEDRYRSCEELKTALAPFVHVEALHDTLPSLAPQALSMSEHTSTEALARAYVPGRGRAKLALLFAGLALGGGAALLELARGGGAARLTPSVTATDQTPPSPVPSERQLMLAAGHDDAFVASFFPPAPKTSTAAAPPRANPRPTASVVPLPPVVEETEASPAPSPVPDARESAPPAAAATVAPAPSSDKATVDIPINRELKRGL
jgi:serine/threonine protein kinase